MSLIFRIATPNDVDVAIPLIYSSGPKAFDYIFHHPPKHKAQDFLRQAFLATGGEFSYENHTVVEKAGHVLGIGTAFSGETTLKFTIAAALQIFRFYGLIGAWDVIRKGLIAESIIQPPSNQELIIGHLGVSPQAQSQGIGSALIEHFLSQESAKGKTPALDVAVTNLRAQALYERLGFVVVREVQSTWKNTQGELVNHRRMEKRA